MSCSGDHPHDEREYRQRPEPAHDIQRPCIGSEDDEAGAKESHERGWHGGPSLRLVGPTSGEQRKQRPAKGERQQHRTRNHVFLRATKWADDKHDRGNEPAHERAGNDQANVAPTGVA